MEENMTEEPKRGESAWRLESGDAPGAQNRAIIRLAEHGTPDGSRPPYVTITIAPWSKLRGRGIDGRWHREEEEEVPQTPTLPFLRPGDFYRDRNGVDYTIVESTLVEYGDEEASIWGYEYLAAMGRHRNTTELTR